MEEMREEHRFALLRKDEERLVGREIRAAMSTETKGLCPTPCGRRGQSPADVEDRYTHQQDQCTP